MSNPKNLVAARYVVTHKEFGIFLGFDPYGNAWWSRHNPLKIPVATTFRSEMIVRACMASRLPTLSLDDCTLHAVDTGGREGATIMELVSAGIDDPELFGDLLEHQEFGTFRH